MAVWSSDALDRHRDILQIIREESYYLHPQFKTKIINEGWASYWHAELFYLYNGVSTVVITARERDAVVEALLAPRYNYGVPRIVIQEVVNNTLCLEHLDQATTFLDRQYANNMLMYIAEIWKQPVNLLTNDEDGRDTTLTARPNI